MKKYKVIRDCHWGFGYREAGSIVELADDVVPPEHFQLLSDNSAPAAEIQSAPTPTSFSEINKSKKDAVIKTGMSAKPKDSEAI